MHSNKSIYYLTVQAKTALHVGTAAGAVGVSDSLFRRDSRGRLLLPGTSIAGAIRSHLTRLAPAMTGAGKKVICDALNSDPQQIDEKKACACIICHLMGDIRPLNEMRDTDENGKKLSIDELERLNGRASRLIIYDAPICRKKSNDESSPKVKTKIRDGVGIDRTTGTAARAASAKFDFETIPADTEFIITLELEDADEKDQYLLDLALYEWQQGRLRFGGNKSRGTGVLSLKKIEVTKFTLSDRADLMRFLRRNVEQNKPELYKLNPPHRNYHGGYARVRDSVQSWLTIDFDLQAQGFFLTNDTTQATAKGYDHRSLLFLPGSSIRGAIRSQAERIARTLVNLRPDVRDEESFLNRCPAPNPFVTRGDKQNGIESSAARIRHQKDVQKVREDRNNSEAYDLSEQLFGSVDWGSRLAVEDAPIVDKDGNPVGFDKLQWKKLDFVAIDRFTGGSADGAKFDAYALWQPRFQCRLHLEAPQDWEIGWLLYMLKDIIDGRVPVGFGAAKGFGDVLLENLVLTLGYAYPETVRSDSVRLSDLPEDDETFFLEKYFDDWAEITQTGWLEAWNTELNRFTVKVEHGKSDNQTYRDPYWRTEKLDREENFLPLNILYRKETSIHDLLK
jgi:CRISPR/Cas system CSM-associated protein Csm3 (group 7 of RAMP superfamily)